MKWNQKTIGNASLVFQIGKLNKKRKQKKESVYIEEQIITESNTKEQNIYNY